jgi:hypothetical protein
VSAAHRRDLIRRAARRGRKSLTAAATALLLWGLAPSAEAFVRSVEYVEVVLGDAQTTSSANLTRGQDPSHCVPFATAMAP